MQNPYEDLHKALAQIDRLAAVQTKSREALEEWAAIANDVATWRELELWEPRQVHAVTAAFEVLRAAGRLAQATLAAVDLPAARQLHADTRWP
jgi:hypothetical protein